MKLENRVAIITGAARGLGEAIAQAFAAEGASLLLVARTGDRLEEVAAKLSHPAGQKVATMAGDVANPVDVAAIYARAVAEFGRVDILVNNAGIQGPIGSFEEVDWDAWLENIRVNLVGTAAMCRAAIPHMKAAGQGKIINLSGGGATGPRNNFSAYAVAKTGVVRLTELLANELAKYNIEVNAIAPGALNTRMLDQVLEAGQAAVGEEFNRAIKQREQGGTSPEVAARLAVFLASSASNGISGRLISAVWDNWSEMAEPEIRERIMSSDVYTLRRIIPQDRGW